MSEKCQRNSCGGEIVDGMCEDCGKPAIGKSILATKDSPSSTKLTSVTSTSSYSATVGTSSSRRKTSRSSRGSSKRRQSLGGGLISLPEQPSLDPLNSLMAKSEVPARKRICPGCGAKVNRTKGFCTQCGAEYNYEPSLKAGDILNDKFEIKGTIAFGGLGWIYLVWDKILSRWVVFKGLLNAKDEATAAAAVAERQFLAAVKHPKIVSIYDFLQYNAEGYIVMEYVGGKTVESLRKASDIVNVLDANAKVIKKDVLYSTLTEDDFNNTIKVIKKGVLPVEEAIAYILGILPAFSYLHTNNLVYCDFKPENFILENNDVKLVDMGAVRKIDDPNGDIYGTRGFMAPEANDNPIEVSDLYTIGRSLATLIMDFDYQKKYENSLPTSEEQPILKEHDSLYRFLLRATHQNPDQRFQSADEMQDQLYGVLREMVAMKTIPRPMESKVFTNDNLLNAEEKNATEEIKLDFLPSLKMATDDIACNDILRITNLPNNVKIDMLTKMVEKYKDKSVEAKLRLADLLIYENKFDEAQKYLKQIQKEDEFDWRVFWYQGKLSFSQEKYNDAKLNFDKVFFEMPGELAPKLALAYTFEKLEKNNEALSFYKRVMKVDPSNTTACFGLARCYQKSKNINESLDAIQSVPVTHILYTQSRLKLVDLMISLDHEFNNDFVKKISEIITSINYDAGIVHELSAKLIVKAIDFIKNGKLKEDNQITLLGSKFKMDELRINAENEYRKAALYSKNQEEKIFWIDLANQVRPKTLF